MAKRNSHSFKKFQKELGRKKKAREKMELRQRKRDPAEKQADDQEEPD